MEKGIVFGVDGGDWKPRSARLRRDSYEIGRRAWIEEPQKSMEAPILPESRSKIIPTNFSLIRSEFEGKSEAFLSSSNASKTKIVAPAVGESDIQCCRDIKNLSYQGLPILKH